MSATTDDGQLADLIGDAGVYTHVTLAVRMFAWISVTVMFCFLVNNYLSFWQGWPGVPTLLQHFELFGSEPLKSPLSGTSVLLATVQMLSYVVCLAGSVVYVLAQKARTLRQDSQSLTDLSAYIIRAAFWIVVLVGLADAFISFLRVENLLPAVVGEELTTSLGRSQFRAPYIHFPLIALSLIIAAFTRSLGFTWLTLLVVLAEFMIVITRFIFSYEQAFMGDLVRFWYAALFLFASAYTLIEEGHVRVDVLYAGFRGKTKGRVNAVGAVLLGMSLCWTILLVGLWGKANIINAPLLILEVSQSGFGMYVKYLMAGFLAIFAISMMVQFSSSLLESVADMRGDPGKRKLDSEIIH
jgi:TRAP-type mannitol/chloroaromatic compound transport system permease small subunit